MPKSVQIAISIVTLLTLLLTACSAEKPVTVPEGAQAGDLILEPCTFEAEKVKYAVDCGTLVVPENRNKPGSRLIAIPVKRIHSSSPNPAEPIFQLDGGPGASNMDFEPPSWLLANHDVVLVGYRGVDGTPKLDCPMFAKAIKGRGDDLLSTESLDAIGKAAGDCAAHLQSEGVDLAGYTIPEVVEDMESARDALGYERINLLSESYGTRVAQIYATMHPERLLYSAMIGVNPPGHFLWLPETVDSQVEYYAELCRQDAECGARMPDLAATMHHVNQSLPSRWMGIPINPGKVKMIAFVLLYHRSTAPLIFDTYLAAEQGDLSGLALMSMAYDLIMPNMMTWGEFLALGSSADFDPGRDYRAELTTPDATLGAPMSLLIWGSAPGHWPSITMADEYRRVQPSDVETLLISGSIDFSTPAQFAEQELLPSLSRGKHVVIAEQGHTSDFWQFQPKATERLLTSFYDTGVADDSLFTYEPMDFHVGRGFPALAKIGLGVVVALVLLVGVVIWLVVRKISRRRATKVAA
ncbi:MAG: alpha/beta fold hydrolase [Anaerolineae bacterium]|nr:alpha/beta fold hydrolase [Anaerolineae bacterium]